MTDREIPDAETPEEFLTALGKKLATRAGTDTNLAGILATFIIRADPSSSAVAGAKDAIMKLAAERASSEEDDGDHG